MFQRIVCRCSMFASENGARILMKTMTSWDVLMLVINLHRKKKTMGNVFGLSGNVCYSLFTATNATTCSNLPDNPIY